MSSCDEFDVVDVVELGGDLLSEEPAGAAGRHGPGLDLLGVTPHEVAEGPLVGDLHSALDEADLVDGLDVGGEPSVDAEDLALNDGANAQVVKDFGTIFPWVSVSILSNSLIIESVNSCNLSSFMISS